MYLNSNNPQFLYLKKLRISAVFDDFESVTDLLCDDAGESTPCDVLDAEFPIREHLIPPLIELVVKALNGSKFQPIEVKNDARDNLPEQARG